MKTSIKVGGIGAAITAVLAISFGIGNAVGPVADSDDPHHTTENTMNTHPVETAGHDTTSTPGGLLVTDHGYSVRLASAALPAGDSTVAFQVIGPDGQPVTDYTETHDKDLHFIAVRRDTSGFQHVHPTIDASGTWTTDLDLTAGTWRFFVDFKPVGAGSNLTLGIDASVAGDFDPRPVPAEARTAAVDGYTVTLDGALVAGHSSELTFRVEQDGQPVTDLEPYLAAYGHLVALRVGDLAYLHVHPEGAPGDGVTEPGPEIAFGATAPSAGSYRLFLDFLHNGVVRTAEFTIHADNQATPNTPAPSVDTTAGAGDGHH